MSDVTTLIAANLSRLRERIVAAAWHSGRTADDVTMVAVTKYVGVDEAGALVAAGCRELGESRPQQLWQKAEALKEQHVAWHLIGHLQRNKVRRTLPLVAMIQSADSERLIAAIDAASGELSRTTTLLLEVNVSGEEAKHGLAPDVVESLLVRCADLEHVTIRGLMAMAGRGGGPEAARADFARLRQLRDRLRSVCPPGVALDELSMGMSGDFEQAIHEGATIVRIGSALFEGIGR